MEISALQLPCHAALPLCRRIRINRLSFPLHAPRRVSTHGISMCLESKGSINPGFESNTVVTYSDIRSDQHKEDSLSRNVEPVTEKGPGESVYGSIEQKRSAKIHDFCFGIPFGGFILGGGFVGFLFSRNIAILSTGVLFGGAIIALSTCSLKVWRQGRSSFPFILGQAVLAAVLAVKNFQMYSLTRKLFPNGFYVAFSAAMLCFYSYVMLSGGNPPPKKLKAAASS